jgi:Protein of unknown function (DUF2795)
MASFNPPEVEKYLKGVNYPATKEELVETAKRNKADQDLTNLLQRLPEREFYKPTDVTHEISNIQKGR